jgi:hypothetical protein
VANPADIRQALAANLEPLGFQVAAYVLDNPTPPCAYVAGGPVDYDETMGRGHDTWTFTVYVMVGYASDIGAQQALDSMRMSHGPTSVKALLEQDRTLGGAAYSLRVPSCTGTRVYQLAGPAQSPAALGSEWTVEVLASGVS